MITGHLAETIKVTMLTKDNIQKRRSINVIFDGAELSRIITVVYRIPILTTKSSFSVALLRLFFRFVSGLTYHQTVCCPEIWQVTLSQKYMFF